MPDQPEQPIAETNLPAPSYRFRRQGRSVWLALALLAWLMSLAALAYYVQASVWWIALLALPILPGLYELVRNPQSGLDLNAQSMGWFTGSQRQTLPLARVSRLRLDTRLDLSVRVTVLLDTGEKLRLPQAATPPVDALTAACDKLGIPHERHHFSLF